MDIVRHILMIHISVISTSVSISQLPSTICWDTVWFNESSPSKTNRSDYEHQSSKVLNAICNGGQVVGAQCKDEKGEMFTSYKNDTSNMYIAVCDVVTGLICTPYNQSQQICPDFSIRYGCQCTATSAVTGSGTTTTGHVTTNQGQSSQEQHSRGQQGQGQQGQGQQSQGHQGRNNGCNKHTLEYMCIIFGIFISVM